MRQSTRISLVFLPVLGLLLAAPPPARAGSCDPRLFSRRFPEREVIRVGQPMDFALFIDRNGSGCGRRHHLDRVHWTIRDEKSSLGTPTKLRSRRSGGTVKWRWIPRRPGVYVLVGVPDEQSATGTPMASRHVLLVLDPRRRKRTRRRVRFDITTGPGVKRPQQTRLQVTRVYRPKGVLRAFTEPLTKVVWRPGRVTRPRWLPPGEYRASAAIGPHGQSLVRTFHVHHAGTVRLDFTATRVSIRLGWTPRDRRLQATLVDAVGTQRKIPVDEAGRADLALVAAGPATLQIVDWPRRRRWRRSPHPGDRPRRASVQHLVIPRQRSYVVRLPGVYLYANRYVSARTTDWRKWPGVRDAYGDQWVRFAGTGVPAGTTALAGHGTTLASVGGDLRRRIGGRAWGRRIPASLRAGTPAAITMLDATTWAWVDRGLRYFPYVTYLTRHGVSQEVLSPDRWCELTGITHTRAQQLVVVGRCRRTAHNGPDRGFIAVRAPTRWRIVKGRHRPLRAITAAKGGFYLADDRGIWHLPRGLRSKPVRVGLSWTAPQAPVTVRQLDWHRGALLALFGPDTTGYCPLHHRSRIAQRRHGRWRVLHDGRATSCGRCSVAGGRCTPRSGAVTLGIAPLATGLWALQRTPPLGRHGRAPSPLRLRLLLARP